jgi:hypothetical protein
MMAGVVFGAAGEGARELLVRTRGFMMTWLAVVPGAPVKTTLLAVIVICV